MAIQRVQRDEEDDSFWVVFWKNWKNIRVQEIAHSAKNRPVDHLPLPKLAFVLVTLLAMSILPWENGLLHGNGSSASSSELPCS